MQELVAVQVYVYNRKINIFPLMRVINAGFGMWIAAAEGSLVCHWNYILLAGLSELFCGQSWWPMQGFLQSQQGQTRDCLCQPSNVPSVLCSGYLDRWPGVDLWIKDEAEISVGRGLSPCGEGETQDGHRSTPGIWELLGGMCFDVY